jgi:hypothetical protein
MKTELILKKLFSQQLYYEKDVMYALVNTRKYLELTETDQDYPKLKFFCDWALHSRLSGPKAQAIVELADAHETANVGAVEHTPTASTQELYDLLKFNAFRNELERFLTANNFETFVTTAFWSQFLGTYVLIISGSPLKCVNKAKALKHVNEVNLVITKLNSPFEASQDGGTVFEVEWFWTPLTTGSLRRLRYSYKESDLSWPAPRN